MQRAFDLIKQRLDNLGWVFADYYPDGTELHKERKKSVRYEDVVEIVNQVASEYGGGWIPFTRRELTESEKAYFGVDSKHMLDCKLPDENEEILVTSRFKNELYVSTDTFMRDGSECYLDSGREFVTEVIAWQPLPKPYKAESEE